MTTTISSGSTSYLLSASGVTAVNVGTRGASTVGRAIYVTGSNDVLTNNGTVFAGFALTGTVSQPQGAVVVSGGAGDSITNGTAGYIHGVQGSVPGINFYTTPGAVTNAGLIVSGEGSLGSSANGVDMRAGGSVTNLSTGSILGGGVYVGGGIGTVINSGTILGDSVYGAVYLRNGGLVTNLAGTIAANGASYGVTIQAAGTVTNAGTITGGSSSGYAVRLTSGFTNRVIVDPGAVFIGTVSGGAPATSTLELASSASVGTVTGFGSQYVNFGTVTFDPSSQWVVKASTAIASSVIGGFGAGDTIDLTGFTATSSATLSGNKGFVLTNGGGSHVTLSFATALSSFSFTTGVSGTDVTGFCFCAGTQIATPAGDVAVERLKQGDMVLTASNGPRAVTWIGEGKVLATRGKRSSATPVIVRSGALGPGVPGRDLRITKGHSLYLDDVLIPVEFLVNHRTILWDDHAQEVHVFHVELATHDVLLANNAPAESYRDDGNRWLFQNTHPGWGQPPTEPYAPILVGGAVVDAVWRRLLDRAVPRALPPMTDDPDLHLIVDGACLDASERRAGDFIFHLPRKPSTVRLASRTMVPEILGVARDPRCLGVAVRRVMLRQDGETVTIRAHDRRLRDGFHDYEAAGDLRWTDGDAALPPELFAAFSGPVDLVVHLGAATRYPELEERQASA